MIIKKYQAMSETDAITLAREELGKDVIVMNVKKINPKGVSKMFKRPQVEITAAVDDSKVYSGEERKLQLEKSIQAERTRQQESRMAKDSVKKEEKSSAIEEKLNNLQSLIEKQMSSSENENGTRGLQQAETRIYTPKVKSKAEECLNLVKQQLLKHEVEEVYIDMILDEVKASVKNDAPVDNILTSIYQKIVLKLGQTSLIEPGEDQPKYIFFMGPTGVGKTTTIAKIASDFKINRKLNVALLTSDTYRIAAVEQLRIYANILKIPLSVVYTADEITKARDELDRFDVVLIDTAGRNHKNREQRDDLRNILNSIEKENRNEYLVLSATTKFADLANIVKAYSDIEDYKLLFTKLDETMNVGNILNIKLLTNAQLSYATCGQDVPKDIGKVDAQSIAKQLLGGEL